MEQTLLEIVCQHRQEDQEAMGAGSAGSQKGNHARAAREPSSVRGLARWARGARGMLRVFILPLCSAPGRPIWSAGSRAGLPPGQERQGQIGASPAKAAKMPEGPEQLRCEGGLGEPGEERAQGVSSLGGDV